MAVICFAVLVVRNIAVSVSEYIVFKNVKQAMNEDTFIEVRNAK